MSTNGVTSWAGDLTNVGAIYPFQGTETLLVIVLLVFWIGWHVLQHRAETREFGRDVAADKSGEETRQTILSY